MTRFARGWMVVSGFGVSCVASAALYAQQAGVNNPLRGIQPPAGNNQPANHPPVSNPPAAGGPRVATQSSAPVQSHAAGQPNTGRQPIAVGQPNSAQGQASNAILPNGQSAQPTQLPIQPPYVLTSQEQAEVDKLLADWESQSNQIKSFKCTFRRWEYNPAFANGNPNQATTESEGEIKYYAPDKGLFRVTNSWDNVINPATGGFGKTAGKPGEYWTCTGESVFEVNHLNKTVEEHPLPPHLRGKAITDGPLPFVFGAKADVLKQRYFMRITTPKELVNQQIWLEAIPKTRQGAANFSRVDLILSKKDLLPIGMQIHDPGATAQNQSRTAIMLENHSINSLWLPIQQLLNNFARPNPIGYRHVLVQPQAPGPEPAQGQPPAQAQNPAAPQAPPRQAAVPQQNRPR